MYSLGGLSVRKIVVLLDETHDACGASDPDGPLRKVAACAVIRNPYAGRAFSADLSALVEGSAAVGQYLGTLAAGTLGGPVQGYGKGAIVGVAGEQEHGNAALTSTFGDAFRAAIGGGRAWISSATKVGAAGAALDVPLAYKDEIWVRSHYDALEVRVTDGPLPDEIVVVAAVSNRGRINARLGGKSVADVLAEQA
jgi:hypothetical protein